MLMRIYNRLDQSHGDSDGVLSNDDPCWPILIQEGLVDSVSQTTLSFGQFKDKAVRPRPHARRRRRPPHFPHQIYTEFTRSLLPPHEFGHHPVAHAPRVAPQMHRWRRPPLRHR